MKIMIGGQDYTSALDAARPLTVERKLNEPSVCQLFIALPANSSQIPVRNQSLSVTSDDGTYFFSGYIAATPMPEYAGLGTEGALYRFAIEAVSDEHLLDQVSMAPGKEIAGADGGALLNSLAAKTGAKSLSIQSSAPDSLVANFATDPGSRFSAAAAKIANECRAAYRAVNGILSLSCIPNAVHVLSEADGSLMLENLALTAGTRRVLANDITVCGRPEPTSYITEYFAGDGVTSQFNLSEYPFCPSSSAAMIIRELFNEGQIDLRYWGNPAGYLSVGAGGLVMQGGTGKDGDTELTWMDPVEMGGTLLLEAGGVTLANESVGVLAGFFVGEQRQDACIAGFQVTARQGTGAVSVQPLVSGSPCGASYVINPANQYTLRLRVHCPENHRGLAVYRSYGDGGAISAGGQWNSAPGQVQFEIQEFVNGVAGMPVTLYDGTIAELPGTCKVVAASSINLYGTMRSLSLTDLGSGWVRTGPASGGSGTRRVGAAVESAECNVESSGRLVFYPGFTPPAGERIAVSYRAVGRAVGRAVNAASQQQLAQQGLSPVSAWIGTATNPSPRSSEDCRNAAHVLEQAAASASALWSGTYQCTRESLDEDIWPGDALQLNAPSADLESQVVVRSVKLSYAASYPDFVHYAIRFANDWADDLAIRTSETVPADAWLPAPISPTYAANLSGLAVTDVSGTAVTINTGTTAPSGGGFEVRRCDNAFMPGIDPSLLLRTSQPTMTFSRVSASDRFYIRAYDGANPPNYSEFSAALIFNTPLGS